MTQAVALALTGLLGCARGTGEQSPAANESRVVVESQGWQLVGDLSLPSAEPPHAAVLMFNQAAGDRTAYAQLAVRLADRGIASLRLDLRGHGESINQGRFVPGQVSNDPLIWDAEQDIIVAYDYLRSRADMAPDRLAIVGASYSGEEMAEAGRRHAYAQAYIALSPGSFSDESVAAIDQSGAAWMLVAAREDPFLVEIVASVRAGSRSVEILTLTGDAHATNVLAEHPGLAERLAVWLERRLGDASPRRQADTTGEHTTE